MLLDEFAWCNQIEESNFMRVAESKAFYRTDCHVLETLLIIHFFSWLIVVLVVFFSVVQRKNRGSDAIP